MSFLQDLLSVLLDENGFWSSLVMKEEEGIGGYQYNVIQYKPDTTEQIKQNQIRLLFRSSLIRACSIFHTVETFNSAPWEFFYAFLSSADFFKIIFF